MKLRADVLITSLLLAAGVGFLAGKYTTSPPPAEERKPGKVTALSAPPQQTASNPGSPKPAAASAPEKFAALHQRIAKMSPQEYARRFAELLAGTNSADALLERAAMLAAVNGERGAAAYIAFKKQTGTAPGRYSAEVEQLFTVGGQLDGANMMAVIQKEAPDAKEIASLVHGWAMADPDAAVEWYNSLPDDYPGRRDSINGLMFGLAQRDAAVAKKVYHSSLSPEDQSVSANLLAHSLLVAHGPEAVDSLIEGLPQEIAARCLEGASNRSGRRRPEGMVPWLATHLGTTGTVDRAFVEYWGAWMKNDPAAAENWRAAAVASNPRIAPLLSPQPQAGTP